MRQRSASFRAMLGISVASCIVVPAFAQDNAPAISAAGQQTGAVEEVQVVSKRRVHPGGGLMADSHAVKAVQTVSRAYIQTQPATTNPIRLLALQPGAVVSSPDPFGIQPGSINVRGLNNNEIGWIFEGAALNDGQLYPNEVVDAPNLESVSLVPGSTDFDLPSSGDAAGAVEILLHDPSHVRGGQISLGYGSYHTQNEYIRLDTGDIGATGIRGFVSYSNVAGNDWRSPGTSRRTHVDTKFIKEWGEGSQTALAVAYNDINFQVERAPTLAQWDTYKTKFNYNGKFTPGNTNYYLLHQNPYRNVYVTSPTTLTIAPTLKAYTDVYMYNGTGIIPGGTNLNPKSAYLGTGKISGIDVDPNGNSTAPANALVYSPTIPTLSRIGFNTNARWNVTAHDELELGYWFEYSERHNIAEFSHVSTSGVPADIWGENQNLYLPDGQLYRYTDNLIRGKTNDIYIGDRMRYLDGKLAIDVGVKNIMFTQNAFNRIPGATYNVNDNQFESLPSLGVRYDFAPHQQIFFDAGVNSKMPDASQLVDVISPTSGVKTTVGSNNQKPEISIVEELGYRYSGDLIVAQGTLFNYNFTNRQISTVQYENSALVTAYINAGGQTSRGVDVSVGTRPFHHFAPFISGEYLHATIDDDIARSGDYLPTAGKTATNSPEWTGNIGLTYDDTHFFGLFQAHYVDKQYSTFMNDQTMPSFYTADMTLGYHFPDFAFLKHPQFQANFVNITDHKYLTGVNSTQYNANTTIGRGGTAIAGAAPTYLVGGGFAALFSISAGF